MNKKNLIFLLIPFLLFSSCKNNKYISNTYNSDLNVLVAGPYKTKNEIKNYEITCREDLINSNNENKYVYTIKISYIDTTLNDLKVIVLPQSNLNDCVNINLPTVGYNHKMNLVPVRNKANKSDYSQYKLQMEKKEKQNSIYVYVGYNSNYDLIKFDREY